MGLTASGAPDGPAEGGDPPYGGEGREGRRGMKTPAAAAASVGASASVAGGAGGGGAEWRAVRTRVRIREW